MPTARPIADALADLPPVGLAELDERAALLSRVDRKYVVPAVDLPLLVTALAGRVLDIDGRRTFGYASTYYDTPDLASFRGAAHRRRRRFKVRTREYLDTGARWVEVKTRGPRGSTVKQRAVVDDVEVDDGLPSDALAFVDAALASSGVTGIDVDALLPVLGTSFRRSTLLLSGDTGHPGGPAQPATRATIDSALRWRSWDGRHLSTGSVLVVETKAPPGAAGALDRRLWALGHRPTRVSKFCVGMALVTPALAANRWHRVVPRLDVRA